MLVHAYAVLAWEAVGVLGSYFQSFTVAPLAPLAPLDLAAAPVVLASACEHALGIVSVGGTPGGTRNLTNG